MGSDVHSSPMIQCSLEVPLVGHAAVPCSDSAALVAWLFNLRGSDVQCNPVFVSYATVGADGSAVLYVEQSKLTEEVKAHLKEAQVTVKDYSLFADDVASATSTGKSVWLDASKVSFAIFNAAKQASVPSEGNGAPSSKRAKTDKGKAAAPSGAASPADASSIPQIVEFASPVNNAKAIKNDAELDGMREAHLRDAVALCELLYTLEKDVSARQR
ncbi:hypothetical protein DUNSADRAFT_8229 [Dunaliella salina]|uniref:Encoded protein n=1 Tax=Dunaliella salina TaxID=3046 RepID=A0ABQ7HA35_DUNSA|nr:hypothetical protein DUNSADRAFT_8229 [Dunaliella salina]|eukprot:KAF5843714.1 hypothetical protein DUNSADRAFT_8229 [Dunaliella salina]